MIPELEGLDTKAGLARIGGNRTLYLKLLRQFLDLQSVPEQIADRLANGDRLTAERLAHTVYGAAAGLGIFHVQAAAAELERTLRGEASADAMLAQLRTVLSDFVARLQLVLPPEGTAAMSTGSSVDPERVAEQVMEMDARLGEFDVAAVELFEAHRHLFVGLFSAAELSAFEKQIGNFAFPEARGTLRQAATEKGMTLS